MLSRPRGQCLLINNVDGFKTMEVRQGSDIDASKLKSLFEQMGFTVLVRRNLASQVCFHLHSIVAETDAFYRLGNDQCDQKLRSTY
jgi:hypothetical protein